MPQIFYGNALDHYAGWSEPTVIISDGAYGIGGFVGDPESPEGLLDWYEPHIAAWTKAASNATSLWFWATEIGWATVHPILVEYGWVYRGLNIWDKGMAHVAGNVNSQTMRKFPIVTEVCALYIREPVVYTQDGDVPVKEWLRREWQRAGFSLDLANEVCGVKNAATRKYLTQDGLWYFPPPDVFEKLVRHANDHGAVEGKPYFALTDGAGRQELIQPEKLRAKFTCPIGVTNVWREPTVRGAERLKVGTKPVHTNQKPLRLMDLAIQASSEPGDVVWEPFGGTCSAAVASYLSGRKCFSAEIDENFHRVAQARLDAERERELADHAQRAIFEEAMSDPSE